ncbi:MAG: GNAT family N-acetyltransferase [Anaerolineae bacterium]|jgi:GNAT superfamily N-acetyltransferase|nr:GNAT family N-acetyltransferase [Anaerolineae bacterium]MDH7475564.1 GNAT family N-acetyltransferase [Anaerolineae bacterium]
MVSRFVSASHEKVNPTDVLVRPYRPEDRAGVRRVYADTAFFGEPVEAFFDDRELFADLGVSVYTDCYADYIFVADSQGEVVGYILGSPAGDADVRAHAIKSLPRVLGRLVTGHYRIGRKTLIHVGMNVWAGLGGELLEVRSAAYPANLHINLEAGYRGQGLGMALIRAYLDKLRSGGVPGVHVVTTNRNEAALQLYRRAGFQLLQEKRTRMWQRYVDGEVRLMALGLRLNETPHSLPARNGSRGKTASQF